MFKVKMKITQHMRSEWNPPLILMESINRTDAHKDEIVVFLIILKLKRNRISEAAMPEAKPR